MTLDPNNTISKQEIAELCRTEAGQKEFFDWLLAQRIAGGLAAIFTELGLAIPDAEDQMKACAIMFHFLRRKPVEDVLDELNLAYRLIAQGVQPAPHEDLLMMTPKGDA